MTHDPTNMLPANPEWVTKVEALTIAAARELGCMVVLVAVQEFGKIMVSVEGAPATGDLALMAQNLPEMLACIAAGCAIQDEIAKKGGKP
jgi:hypothetical protein